MYRKTFHGGSRGGSRPFSGSRSRSSGRKQQTFRDVSKFINKAEPIADVKPYESKNSFADFQISDQLKKNISHSGYVTPTAIQDQTIPVTLAGSDIVGIANTGTGKTAAFLIPLLDKVIRDRTQKVLIMAPTRELAIQIDEELKKFSFGTQIYSVCAVGGAPINWQIRDLSRSYNFLIGTPGRLKDLLERRTFSLNSFQSVVLDEADRMLDMGFVNDMRTLMAAMPKDHQTLFFSATLSPDIKKLIGEFLRNPINISVKTGDTSKNVDQDVVYVRGAQKFDLLHDLLSNPEFNKVLIFGRTKHGVERLANNLSEKGHKAGSIHGDKNHNQRQHSLKAFKDNIIKVLVATDVAARGLDIPNVTHVINYELPATHEDYIHRIGRTGRAGRAGKALTFID